MRRFLPPFVRCCRHCLIAVVVLVCQSKARCNKCKSSGCLAAVHQQIGGGNARDGARASERPGLEVPMLLSRPPGEVDAISLHPNCRCKVSFVRRQDNPRFQARCECSLELGWGCRVPCLLIVQSSCGFRQVQASCVPSMQCGHVRRAACLRTGLHCTCAKLCVGSVCTAAAAACRG